MNLIKWIKRKSILKKRIIFFEKKLKNAMDINNLNFHEGEIYGALHLAYDLGIIDYEGYQMKFRHFCLNNTIKLGTLKKTKHQRIRRTKDEK